MRKKTLRVSQGRSRLTSVADRRWLSNEVFLNSLVVRDVLLEQLGQSGIVVVGKDEVIAYVSQRAQRLLGLPRKKLIGANVFKAIEFYNQRGEMLNLQRHPGWQALHQKHYRQVTPFFCYYRRSKKMVTIALRPLQIVNNKTVMGAIFQVREAARKLNVDEMKSLFVSFAAHQLKTPSSIVKGFLELLLRNGKKAYTPEQWGNLQSAYESNESLINLSRALLNLTRLEGGLIEPQLRLVNIRQAVDAKVLSRRLLLEIKKIDLEITVDKAAIFETDEIFISEILDILLNNAIKYSPIKGKIRIIVSINRQGLNVEVHDQGPGMTKDDVLKLFKQMAPDDPSHNAHGVGLLIAKKYLDLLGGTIEVESQLGAGSRFLFIIPSPIP